MRKISKNEFCKFIGCINLTVNYGKKDAGIGG